MKNLAVVHGAKLLRALGNAHRLEIIFHLMNQELKVGDLEKLSGLSQSALSQHLAILRAEKIVKTRRNAQSIFYSISSDKVIKLTELLNRMYNKLY